MSADPRFARLKTDPRFRRPKTQQHKVVVDERFKSLFDTDKSEGKRKGPKVDKYGRRVSQTKEKAALKNFYRLENEDDENEHGQNAQAGPSEPRPRTRAPDYARGKVLMESSDEDEADSDNSENDDGIVELGAETYLPKKRSSKIHFDDDDPEAQINLDESEFADLDAQAAASVRQSKKEGHGFGEQKRTTAQGQETSRLAVVNLDWDFIKAAHLFSVFSSTAALAGDPEAQVKKRRAPAPKDGGGKIARVRIYPSEFGKSRLAKEDVEGPPKEIFANPQKEKKGAALLKSHGETFESDSDEDLDVEDINEKTIYHQGDVEEYDQDALRKYQLERLRYYYAIIDCDSPATAAFLYKELDATELERTANLLDLSFVPDDVTFDEDFRDEATQDLENIKSLDFSTDALRHSKVKLTWDDDDQERVTFTRRHLSAQEIEDNDFKAFLASSGESESEPDGPTDTKATSSKATERNRLRTLLLGGGGGNGDEGDFFNDDLPEGWGGMGKNKAGDLEITFTPGLTEDAKDVDEENVTTLDRYKKKMQDKKQTRMSTWEKNKEAQERLEEKEKEKREGPAVLRDDFFDVDSEEEPQSLAPMPNRKKVRGSTSPSPSPPPPTSLRDSSTAGELALLAADVQANPNEPKHFDMSKVIKAEKDKTKKKKLWKKKGKGETEDAEEEKEREDGEGFEIDVNDERFKALHEEHHFAIDPSNPHFKKTKSMNSLLEERRKRLKHKVKSEVEQRSARVHSSASKGGEDTELKRLVESVKRKTTKSDSRPEGGKRRKL